MLFKSRVDFSVLKGTEVHTCIGELVESKRYGDDEFELTYELVHNGELVTIIIDNEGNQIIDNSTEYFVNWDVCEHYRTKEIFYSTLREYFGDTYEELFEQLTDGLLVLTDEERIEFTLRDFFMDLEVLNDELNSTIEEVSSKIIERCKS